MTRKVPRPPADWEKKLASARSQADRHKQTYTIHVVTPMFGGGVEPGVNDPITPIRPTSIRGHLRFWWRGPAARTFRPRKPFGNAKPRSGDRRTTQARCP